LNHDPVLRLARTLAAHNGGAARLALRDAATHGRIEEAVKFALESPLPAADTALERVFA
jgi:TPP-dependent pyruvate/acetoin dehydrogenase alpha subunit